MYSSLLECQSAPPPSTPEGLPDLGPGCTVPQHSTWGQLLLQRWCLALPPLPPSHAAVVRSGPVAVQPPLSCSVLQLPLLLPLLLLLLLILPFLLLLLLLLRLRLLLLLLLLLLLGLVRQKCLSRKMCESSCS